MLQLPGKHTHFTQTTANPEEQEKLRGEEYPRQLTPLRMARLPARVYAFTLLLVVSWLQLSLDAARISPTASLQDICARLLSQEARDNCQRFQGSVALKTRLCAAWDWSFAEPPTCRLPSNLNNCQAWLRLSWQIAGGLLYHALSFPLIMLGTSKPDSFTSETCHHRPL